jgi:hypothetical protein
MTGTTTMAKKQVKAKTKAPATEGTSRAFRMSREYADWLERLASKDRSTVAGLMDRAIAHYARHIDFTETPPERV